PALWDMPALDRVPLEGDPRGTGAQAGTVRGLVPPAPLFRAADGGDRTSRTAGARRRRRALAGTRRPRGRERRNGFAADLDAVQPPDVGLEVRPDPVLDDERREPAGEDVFAVRGEGHAGPLGPAGRRPVDDHRFRRGGEDLATDAFVYTEPGIEVRPVVAAPL